MTEFKVIEHQHISEKCKHEICKIKSAFGDYTLASQLNWLEKNLSPHDMHLLLYENNNLVAYMNLIKITITLNGHVSDAIGVGNVCSAQKGSGHGRKLMLTLNDLLSNWMLPGLLFCKENLLPFYNNFRWTSIDKSVLKLQFECSTVHAMINTNEFPVEIVEYSGVAF